jgi:hypothetical protein
MDTAEMRETHRGQWRERLVRWLVPRLAGDEDQKETSLEMVCEAVSTAYDEGIADAADIIERLHEAAASEHKRALAIAAKALRDLSALNAAPAPPRSR